MNANNLSLVRPNILTAKDCREAINYNANIRLSNISNTTARSDLVALAKYLQSVDQRVNTAAREAVDILDGSDIEYSLSDLEDSDDPATLSVYENSLKQIITKKKEDFNALVTGLTTPAYNLKTMSLTSNKNKLAELGATAANLQVISEKEKNGDYYDTLLKQKSILDEAIRAFDGQTFFDKVSPIVDQIEKTLNDGMDSPANFKKTLVKDGVAVAKQVLSLINNVVKYNDMVDARRGIILKINERDKRALDVDRQLKNCFEETSQLLEFEKLRDIKSEYVQEVEKFIAAFNTFISVVFSSAPSTTKDIAQRFLANAPTLRAYAGDIFKEWLRT